MTRAAGGPGGLGPPNAAYAAVAAAYARPDGAVRPDERLSDYREVECDSCGAIVRAAKFSVQHTSVQWDATAVRQCAEFARKTAAGEQTPLIERCGSMRASIEAAALAGRLPVAPPWLAEK